MLLKKYAGLAVAIVLMACGNAEAHKPCRGGHCGVPTCTQCVPQRITYGYFPTMWRRWPIQEVAAAPVQQPENLPAPAEESVPQPPSGVPEIPGGAPSVPGKPDEFGAPPFEGTPPLQTPGEDPLAPPLPPSGDGVPPAQGSPLTPPSGGPPIDILAPPSTSSPLDDAPPLMPAEPAPTTPAVPPALPSEPSSSGKSPLDAPSDKLPEAPGLPTTLPGDEAAPAMPADDPFKDEPESSPLAPPAATPQSSQLHRANMPESPLESAAWHSGSRVRPVSVKITETVPTAPSQQEPRRLQLDQQRVEVDPLPEKPVRTNPLRRTTATHSPERVVPTSGLAAAESESVRPSRTLRPNPLRAR